MKKSLIALMVATLPAAAFADVTVFGTIKGGVEYVDNASNKQTNIDDLGSRIGFKGNEDLGNGLKAIWQVETGFGIDGQSRTGESSGTFGSRESFVGLSSNFGTFRLGHLANYGESDMAQVNPWESSSNALQLNAFTRGDGYVKNAVRFDTPEFAGFQAAFLYGTKEDKSNAAANKDRETYNLGLSYENSGFFGKYQYIHESPVTVGLNASSKANNKHRIEAGYNANNIFVALGYRNDKGDATVTPGYFLSNSEAATDGRKYESQEYALTAGYQIGAFMPKFTYAQSKDVKIDGVKQNDSGYKQYLLGVDYSLSKRTVVGAQYGEIKMDGNAKAMVSNGVNTDKIKAFGLNVVHKF
ncbi:MULTISPECIES: porin [Chromobacterium]|uniref:Porin n=1 Tax=Chromobacterium rhizoryzae TaxID=1778675 RepID=A0AAD0W701_9NEIS|nr:MULTISPECIES: porin [Chromobacterium]AXT45684.1 porin [Chromobacterium rhizoryzae]QOD83947.1 porin [Chromobacterium haemolyticum]